MKRIRICMVTWMLLLSACALTACGSDNSANQATQATQSTQSTSQPAVQDPTQSTGVIDGMIHDVEDGVDDLLDEPTAESNRSDESK